MNRLLKYIGRCMDNYRIRKKLLVLYMLCVLVPLIVTDSVVIYIVLHTEQISRRHEMQNTANAVQYSFCSSIETVAALGKRIYMNKYADDFLDKQYSSAMEYVSDYQDFFKGTLFENKVGMDNVLLTMYSDNDTIVNGGEVDQLKEAKKSNWYQYLSGSGLDKALYFDYDDSRAPAVAAKRKIFFLQKLGFYSDSTREKVLKAELDYGSVIRDLNRMNYNTEIYICWNDKIVLSNGKHANVGQDFEPFTQWSQDGYSQDITLYGITLKIYVLQSEAKVISEIIKNLPILLLLVMCNAVLPIFMMRGINRSFTTRLGELSEVFNHVEGEQLQEITNVRGTDEIGDLMRNYNKMAVRINSLIEIVYKNRIQEQEMMVARQKAELLALHSQINPHFLFNALESIRMHSIIKRELETADMVEKLAIMQRQYVEWGNDQVTVEKELDFVQAYLELQKYRFGDRLSFELDVEKRCRECKIPKLSIVTFVENSCIHGIESKTTPGWIFVRISIQDGCLCMEIEDTGVGMNEEEQKALLEKMRGASIEILKVGRVGIVNACLRLKMISQDEVEFELDGEEGVGNIVRIRIPLSYV